MTDLWTYHMANAARKNQRDRTHVRKSVIQRA